MVRINNSACEMLDFYITKIVFFLKRINSRLHVQTMQLKKIKFPLHVSVESQEFSLKTLTRDS